jgi:tetratricopeptide (TPR) repeat protein
MALALLVVVPSMAAAQQLANEEDRRAALSLYRSGEAYMRTERFEQAAQEFTRAIEKDPLFTLAHYQLGQAYMALRRYASAIIAYEGCIAAGKTLFGLSQANRFEVERARDDEIRELRASLQQMALNGQLNRQAHAEQHLQELERQRSSLGGTFQPSAEVLLALGSARFRNGDTNAAMADWLAAAEANPKLGEAHNNLAAGYAMSGRKQDAANAVRAAERAGYRVNPQLKRDIEQLP